MDKDLYEILGVKKNATEGEIRKAFLKLAKKHHPDVNPGNKEAEQRFKEMNLAYEVLKDPKKRQHYDQMRAAGANPFAGPGDRQYRYSGGPGGPESFTDFGLGDLFQEIFGGGGGGFGSATGRRGGSPFAQRGADLQTTIQVPFLDAARGAERVLDLGDNRRLTVKIPEGVDDGAKIKLSGQGEPGMGGGPRGDLLITLKVSSHPFFQREGKDIVVRVPITFSEAVLGGEIDIPIIGGKVVMKVPKGVSSGQRLKLAGKGIKSGKAGTRGDQFVELLIKIPKPPDNAYTEAAEKLKKDSFDPRAGVFQS